MNYRDQITTLAQQMNKLIKFETFIVGGENDPSDSYEVMIGGRVFKTEISYEATFREAYFILKAECEREKEMMKNSII